MLSVRRFAGSFASELLCAVLVVTACGGAYADDYVRDLMPSRRARAYFRALQRDAAAERIERRSVQKIGEDEAYYMDDGSISIPPKAMVSFRMCGRCMDPHLPAPAAGEPMQFVDVGRLVPRNLREMYDNLIKRQMLGDERVNACNPQHLVWAIRTAGTDSPLANSLSEAQIALLDECAGRRGAFLKYHEKMRRRFARKARKCCEIGRRVSVGNLEYDVSELSGTNGARCVEAHIAALTEMGEKSKVRTEAEFRFGEIDENLYSDIVCDGGLSFTARVLNASDRRVVFRAADFAAQVGRGGVGGGKRQRVTMSAPDEIMVVKGALQEGVMIEQDQTIIEDMGEESRHVRGRLHRRRTAEWHERIPPMPPVSPIVFRETNTVVETKCVTEEVSVCVDSLEYDEATRKGALIVEVVSGPFKTSLMYIRKNFNKLVREKSPPEDAAKIPEGAKLKIESVSITEKGFVKIEFTAK